ncbi:hypothetical protein ACFRMQ_01995 [Kitasatospora sp. NPDC056783]|uniref:hypothetical protein n=1 Tax=Kitasatospora sp. NPDC056783 TaxID=3345943 RepID=UPI0036A41352
MRTRRTPWSLVYFPTGAVLLLVAAVMAVGVVKAAAAGQVVSPLLGLIPIVLLGVPGVLLTFRAPVFGVSYGSAGLRYSGLLGARSHAWADVREVRVAVLPGRFRSSDVPELVLASGGTDQLSMLSGPGSGRTNKRVVRLVAELEAARAAAS